MSDERATTPSPRAVQRLGEDISSEVGDLRSALRAALEEADRHEAAGRPDRAAAVLSDQQDLLALVHRRLEDRLAAAAVEREAEGVLDAASPAGPPAAPRPTSGSAPATVTDGAPVPGPAAQSAAAAGSADGEGMALRLLTSVAAAVVGVVLLLAPDPSGVLTAAGWSGVRDGDQASVDETGDPGDDGTGPDAGTAAATDGTVPWSIGADVDPPSPLARRGGTHGAPPAAPHADADWAGSDEEERPGTDDDLSAVSDLLEGLDDVDVPVIDADGDGEDEAADEESEASSGEDEDAQRSDDSSVSEGLGAIADEDGEGSSSAR